MENRGRDRRGERGSAGAKFICVLAFIILVANAGYNYIPVRYQAESMKGEMETAVLQGIAMPGKMNPVDNVKGRILRALAVNELPPETYVEVKQSGNGITARVAYVKNVSLLPFGIYNYVYTFDHTATPTGFLLNDGKPAQIAAATPKA